MISKRRNKKSEKIGTRIERKEVPVMLWRHFGDRGYQKEKGRAVSDFPLYLRGLEFAPGETRTHGPRIRNPVLYPPELRGHKERLHREIRYFHH